MNILPYLHFLGFIVNLFLAVYIFVKNPKSLLNSILSVFLSLFSIWSLGWVFVQNINTSETLALFIVEHLGFAWYLYPYLFFWFALVFVGAKKILKSKIFYLIIFLPPTILSYLDWRGDLFTVVKKSYGWAHIPTSVGFFNAVVILQLLVLLVTIITLLVFGKKTKDLIKKKQVKIIFFSTLAAIVIGFGNVFISTINENIPNFSNLSVLILGAGLVYAIVKYRLLTITPSLAAEKIIETMPDMLFLLDENWNIVSINKVAADTLGHTEKELVGSSIDNLIKGGIEAGFRNLKEVKDKQMTLITKDGSEIPASFSGSVAKNNETSLEYVVIVAKDMRGFLEAMKKEVQEREMRFSAEKYAKDLELKVKERTVELSENMIKLEKMNKDLAGMELKTEFIQILNHQLRTPITVFKWYLELWKSDKYRKLTAEKQSDIKNNIFIAADQLSDLVNNMLDAVEVEGGVLKLNIEKVDLGSLVETIYRTNFENNFKEKKIGFKLLPSAAPSVFSDEKYLSIIIYNLLDNALKYTSRGEVEVRLSSEDGSMIISVRDTGIGLSERDKAGLFQKFVRGESASKVSPGGSGLGLYIVKKIADAIHGEIRAESEGRNKGSVFSLKIPVDLRG